MKKRIWTKRGFNIVELMVVTFIMTMIIGGSFMVLSSGQSAWFLTDSSIQLEENLRQGMTRMTRELAETTSAQLTLTDNGGVGGSDILKFSIPVVCQNNVSVIDIGGNVAYWRAPLTWGCTSSTCMDADNDCNTIDYKFLEYRLNNSNQLVRHVLNNAGGLVREDVVARNMTNLQATLDAGQEILTLVLTAQATSVTNRVVTTSKTIDIRFRN
ncbi:MAG: hypothetical protein A3D10_05505 [Omnitrophica WOR_2 bacterium RIFCSPHIGHO2_02_FULL_48_11]|nr:MAG: hypothetical protein A3D10_05505 [Omnitrophica WOR_2 bacterium RIFCSPHIGHO2_02_FULL_48_11]